MTVTLTNLELETYAGSVEHDYILADLFGTNWMEYWGPEDSETLNQPVVVHGDGQFIDDGGDHTNEDASILGNEIALYDPIKASNRVKKRSVDERPGLRHLENLGRSHGKSVGKGKSLALLVALCKVADSLSNVITVDADATDGSAPGEIKDGVKQIAAAMDEGEVDPMDRYAMLKSSAFYDLADEDGVISKDFGAGGNRAAIGGNLDMIKYLNYPILNVGIGFGQDYTSSAHDAWGGPFGSGGDADFDMTDVIGVFWQKRAWGLREQTQIEKSIDWIARLQVWQVLSRMQFGFQEFATANHFSEGIYILKNASP